MRHAWNVSIAEAKRIQEEMRGSVRLTPLSRAVETIAGADVSFNRFSDRFFACVALFSYPALEPLEAAYAEMRVAFPYVPGYLSFREVPVIAEAYAKLSRTPDVVMMDGQGVAHPRRIGVASHLGLALETPTFGCAKSRLFGDGEMPAPRKGSVSHLRDPHEGDVVGAYVRTKDKVAPVIVSPGHRITLEECVELTLSSVRAHRIPEPTRRAHELVNAYRRSATLG